MVKKGFAYLSLLLFAACGEVAGSPDAAGDDDEIDASTIDADPSGTAEITTLTRCCNAVPDAPEAGVRVIVTLPDGTIGDSVLTDANGEASVTVLPGSTVTAIYIDPNGTGANQLVSYTGVEPGDTLTFGEKFNAASTTLGSMTASWPTVAGATGYRVFTPCGSSSVSAPTTSVMFTESDSCHVQPMDLLFVANDAAGPIRWGLAPNVTFSPGGSTNLITWQAMNSITLSVVDMPSDVTQVEFGASAVLNNRTTFSASISGTPSGGMLSGTQPWTTGGDAVQTQAFFGRETFGIQQVIERIASTSTTATLDGSNLLPWLSTATASGATREVTWETEGTVSGDGMVVFLRWPQSMMFGGSSQHEWILVAAPSAAPFALPNLGPDGADFDVPAAATPTVNGGVLDLGADDGYDDYRARPEWEVTLEDDGIFASGRIAVTIFSFAN